jgi:hypothetical protein
MIFDRNNNKKFNKIVIGLMVSLALCLTVIAQSGTSSIKGTITDKNGAVVSGAAVKLSNPVTGFSRSVTTDNDGKYSFPGIPPAVYKLEVEAANFKRTIKSDAQASVDSVSEVNLALEPGDVTAVVNVTSDTIDSIVNTQDASIGHNFVPKQITQLPTNLRRVNDLLTLQPGVTREGYVAGGRSDQANITLDGIDINDQQDGGRSSQFSTTQSSVLRATTESVEEFRITTTNANANQGRSSGAQISLVTKGGTNSWRGSAFYFYRPTAFSANDFFNNASGRFVATDVAVLNGTAKVGDERAPRPSLARDVFGGSFGGPIIKDKLFFFYSFEAQREKSEVAVVRTVPLAHLGQGSLRFNGTLPGETRCTSAGVPAGCTPDHLITVNTAALNAIYPNLGINSAAVTVLQGAASRYAANDTSVGDGRNTGGYRFNAPTTIEENTHIARFDYNMTSNQSIFVRGNYQFDIRQGASAFPDTPSTSLWDHPIGFVIGHNWTIGTNMVNNFRYGLTRQSYSNQGDSSANNISFRFVYSPSLFARTLSRVTPTQNYTDDFTWVKGNHTLQFGGNVRLIRNKRDDLASAYDSAITNPSFYQSSGAVLTNAFTAAGYNFGSGERATIQAAAAALIGRYSQYSGNFTFDINGKVLPAGTPASRNFATEEYDFYLQDAWKPFRNLTLTLGLRYGASRPVYEKNGYQVVPTQELSTILEQRELGSLSGVPFNGLITFEKGGPANNNGKGFYRMDWNNVQPRVAFAWSPNFENGILKAFFGGEGKSTIRGGFAMTNDHFGGQLAVSFDALSTIGFTSASTIAANTYGITAANKAPLFTGFNQDIRALPGIPAPQQRFGTEATPDCIAGIVECPQRIETSLDSAITTPTHYSWNLSWGRQLPKGMYFEASYIGHSARHLLASRDVMAFNNIKDPLSGMDWYTAAGLLAQARSNNTPITSLGKIAFFENFFPNIAGNVSGLGNTSTQEIYGLVARDGYDILDWTYVQTLIDDVGRLPNLFVHPQYAAFSAFSSVATSDYHGASFSLRQRLGETLTYDFNYTFSKSIDDVSGLQNGGSYGSQFILNPLRPGDQRALSDFDSRHVINANFVFQLPVGKGQKLGGSMNRYLDAIVGGWQLAGIYRFNSGLPFSGPFDAAQWATNWNVQSNGTPLTPVTVTAVRDTQNAFVDPAAAYKAYRNALAGESGPRNTFTLPAYWNLDLGLSKSFTMPWSENHKLQLRWEVFNVPNFQAFNNGGESRSTWGLSQDPNLGGAPSNFGKIYTSTQGSPRAMQFGLRYAF